MPVIIKEDNILKNNTNYRFIIFFDQDEPLEFDQNWEIAHENIIDSNKEDNYFFEYLFDKGSLFIDTRGVHFHDDYEPKVVTDDNVNDQNITIVWGWANQFDSKFPNNDSNANAVGNNTNEPSQGNNQSGNQN